MIKVKTEYLPSDSAMWKSPAALRSAFWWSVRSKTLAEVSFRRTDGENKTSTQILHRTFAAMRSRESSAGKEMLKIDWTRKSY